MPYSPAQSQCSPRGRIQRDIWTPDAQRHSVPRLDHRPLTISTRLHHIFNQGACQALARRCINLPILACRRYLDCSAKTIEPSNPESERIPSHAMTINCHSPACATTAPVSVRQLAFLDLNANEAVVEGTWHVALTCERREKALTLCRETAFFSAIRARGLRGRGTSFFSLRSSFLASGSSWGSPREGWGFGLGWRS
jgi:hypothetical protein